MFLKFLHHSNFSVSLSLLKQQTTVWGHKLFWCWHNNRWLSELSLHLVSMYCLRFLVCHLLECYWNSSSRFHETSFSCKRPLCICLTLLNLLSQFTFFFSSYFLMFEHIRFVLFQSFLQKPCSDFRFWLVVLTRLFFPCSFSWLSGSSFNTFLMMSEMDSSLGLTSLIKLFRLFLLEIFHHLFMILMICKHYPLWMLSLSTEQ